MAKKMVGSVVEEEEVRMHLYRVVFRRTTDGPAGGSRTRTYVTFGMSEEDAIARVWDAYHGSKFQEEFSAARSVAELVLGDIMKVGG